MKDNRQNELQDLLKEGISALKDMRKGIQNACAELRTHYVQVSSEDVREAADRRREGGQRRRKDERAAYDYYQPEN